MDIRTCSIMILFSYHMVTLKFHYHPVPYSTKLRRQKTLAVCNQSAKILSTNNFYPPIIFILAILLCKAANPPMFCLPKCLLVAICQSFVPYGDYYVASCSNSYVHIFIFFIMPTDWINFITFCC